MTIEERFHTKLQLNQWKTVAKIWKEVREDKTLFNVKKQTRKNYHSFILMNENVLIKVVKTKEIIKSKFN